MSFGKVVELANCKEVREGIELPKVHLHKWLVLSQTAYLCENGTLSDGHEKITDAQKYAQSLRELYLISLSIQGSEAEAMVFQADLIDAENELKMAARPSEKLRAEAKLKRAQLGMLRCSVDVEDRSRMVKFYYNKIKELQPAVEAKYPLGIEQAEEDNWMAVAKYRLHKEKTPGLPRERMDNIPLPILAKARLGLTTGRIDALAPLLTTNPQLIEDMSNKESK